MAAVVTIASLDDVSSAKTDAFDYSDSNRTAATVELKAYTDGIAAQAVRDMLAPLVPPSPEGVDKSVVEVLKKTVENQDGTFSEVDIHLPTVGFVDGNIFNANVEAKSYALLKATEAQASAQANAQAENDALEIRLKATVTGTDQRLQNLIASTAITTLNSANTYTDEQIAGIVTGDIDAYQWALLYQYWDAI